MKHTEGFKQAFAKRGKTDYRKWAEFLNLIKGFARLNGRGEIYISDVTYASELFQDSLSTLADNFSLQSLQQGINYDHLELHKKILKKFGSVSGATAKVKDLKRFAQGLKWSKEWDELLKIKRPDGTMLVEIMGDEAFVKPNWDGEAQ